MGEKMAPSHGPKAGDRPSSAGRLHASRTPLSGTNWLLSASLTGLSLGTCVLCQQPAVVLQVRRQLKAASAQLVFRIAYHLLAWCHLSTWVGNNQVLLSQLFGATPGALCILLCVPLQHVKGVTRGNGLPHPRPHNPASTHTFSGQCYFLRIRMCSRDS
jgi:hypothetical protein